MDGLDTIKWFTKKVFWITSIGESFGALGLILGKKTTRGEEWKCEKLDSGVQTNNLTLLTSILLCNQTRILNCCRISKQGTE